MSPLEVGYARATTDERDLTAQRDGLAALGVEPQRVCVDHGLTDRHADPAGLRQALAACRGVDTFVVTKLDRLARSVVQRMKSHRALLSRASLTDQYHEPDMR